MNGLRVEGLRARHDGFRLGPVDLTIAGGAATVLLGPSGAGKTTLLQALAGFCPVEAGGIWLDDEPLVGRPPEARRAGFIPPGLGLFPHLRVAANVGYALERAEPADAAERTGAWLERFDLAPLARRFPAQLSSGERQRVALARALAGAPRWLLWDEPLSALDVERRYELIALLREVLAEERQPLVIVTHAPATAFSLASGYVRLDRGRVLFAGPAEEFLARPRDRFHARFLGYPNVYGPAELAAAEAGSLGAFLRGRAGPEGLAAPAEAFRVDGLGSGGAYRFRFGRRERRPDRTVWWGTSEGLAVRAVAEPGRPPPTDPVGLRVIEDRLLPLGPTEEP